ncbi:VMAP-C domain-containing protein [Streptomyces longispororuber]|uniref:VMAP-C domain-containing protein n=1 Tax=Streptomyces longispororuber TaxID=68230 RepID=UPI00210A0F5B|nr:trypsin-like peptidase domain-containing protein [Streptomyces longispororuber]MCQ4213725.1 serine protease [Streptomyces longispororuber]
MNGAKWQARVVSGTEVGAGFLVTPRMVLTCAHVITDEAPVTVTFPQLPGEDPVGARLHLHGGWRGGAAPGDLAVLELDRDMDIPPAEFALPGAAFGDPPPRLLAYGFPRHYDEGTLAEYRAKADLLVGDEWVELVALDGHGQPMEGGFSGAAVTLAGSHRVVGMVTQTTGGRGVLASRMLPLDVMARYWPDLADRIPCPAPAAGRPDTGRLHTLIEKATRTHLDCDPERLYRYAVGEFGPDVPPGGFASLWAAAVYVLSEVDEPDAVARFTERLDALLDAPAPPAAAPRWTPVLVDVQRSGAGDDQALVEVSAYSAGRRHPVASRTLAESEVAAYVRDVIDDALAHLPPGTDELVAFTLPPKWLNWPVDRWPAGPDDPTPLGCAYPVVVTHPTRRQVGPLRRLTRRWQDSAGRPVRAVHRVGCDGGGAASQRELRVADVAGFARPPGAVPDPRFDAALSKPVPALLWPRTGCAKDHEPGAGCPGGTFLDELGRYVTGAHLAELPYRIMELREAADARDDHWAGDVQLLWDAPHCFPDPRETGAPHRSPVA